MGLDGTAFGAGGLARLREKVTYTTSSLPELASTAMLWTGRMFSVSLPVFSRALRTTDGLPRVTQVGGAGHHDGAAGTSRLLGAPSVEGHVEHAVATERDGRLDDATLALRAERERRRVGRGVGADPGGAAVDGADQAAPAGAQIGPAAHDAQGVLRDPRPSPGWSRAGRDRGRPWWPGPVGSGPAGRRRAPAPAGGARRLLPPRRPGRFAIESSAQFLPWYVEDSDRRRGQPVPQRHILDSPGRRRKGNRRRFVTSH